MTFIKKNSKISSKFRKKPDIILKNKKIKNKNNFKNNQNKNSENNSNFENDYKNKFEKNFGKNTFNKLKEIKNKNFNDIFIRINISKNFPKKIEDFLIEKNIKFSKTFLPNSIKIEESNFKISSSIPALNGEIYIQDLASQTPINLIDFEKYKGLKINILDLAASPGSKTSQICDLCNFYNVDYNLIACEKEEIRIKRLINNLQKQEFNKVEILNTDALNFQSQIKFDIILLDAPCSGNLVGDKNWIKKRDFKGINEKVDLQKKLIKKAETLLKNDGILIYSTCSIENEENEENILWAENNTKLKSIPIDFKFDFETNPKNLFYDENLKIKYSKINAIRFLPYLSKTQGFFVSLFKKN